MTYPSIAPAAYPVPTDWGATGQYLNTDQDNTNAVANYAWLAADSAPVNVRVATTGAEAYTIVSGSVTAIAGRLIDGVPVAVNDLILVKDAPAASGPGAVASRQSANGIYWMTGVDADNISVARAATMSPASSQPNPARRVVFLGAGGATNGPSIFQVTTPYGVDPFIYGATAVQWTQYGLTPTEDPTSVNALVVALAEGTAPAPVDGVGQLYVASDGSLHFVNSTTDTQLTDAQLGGPTGYDGGNASSVYVGSAIDGGGASTVYSEPTIDGGGA